MSEVGDVSGEKVVLDFLGVVLAGPFSDLLWVVGPLPVAGRYF